jgi:signal transduction histidine kinase
VYLIFKTGGIPPDTFISSVVRQQVYLIFKEAINNIAKHAEATSVQIIMAPFNRKGLQLIIHDNGKGFNESEVRKGDGLRNMQKRAQTIHAELKLETDRGVRWILTVPKIS